MRRTYPPRHPITTLNALGEYYARENRKDRMFLGALIAFTVAVVAGVIWLLLGAPGWLY